MNFVSKLLDCAFKMMETLHSQRTTELAERAARQPVALQITAILNENSPFFLRNPSLFNEKAVENQAFRHKTIIFQWKISRK